MKRATMTRNRSRDGVQEMALAKMKSGEAKFRMVLTMTEGL